MTVKTTIVPSAQDAANADYIICHRVTDLPIPHRPAQIENCCKCGERIWCSINSPKKPLRICFKCMEPTIAKGKISQDEKDEVNLLLTKDTLDVIKRWDL